MPIPGLLEIKDTFNVSVMFEENVTEARQLEKIVSVSTGKS